MNSKSDNVRHVHSLRAMRLISPGQDQVRHDCQNERDDNLFPRIDKAQHKDLVHDIENQRKNEQLAGTFPSVLDHVGTVGWVGN